MKPVLGMEKEKTTVTMSETTGVGVLFVVILTQTCFSFRILNVRITIRTYCCCGILFVWTFLSKRWIGLWSSTLLFTGLDSPLCIVSAKQNWLTSRYVVYVRLLCIKVILCASEHICSIVRYCFRSFKQLTLFAPVRHSPTNNLCIAPLIFEHRKFSGNSFN